MEPVYAIYFVPHLKNRKSITKLRSKLCKKYKSNVALQYPVHITLTLAVKIKNYKLFKKEIRKLCSKEKPHMLKAKKYTNLKIYKDWLGILFIKNNWLIKFQKNLQKIVNKHAKKIERRKFIPHISLVYETNLKGIKRFKTHVKKFKFDRITIIKQQKRDSPYRIYKHIKLKD